MAATYLREYDLKDLYKCRKETIERGFAKELHSFRYTADWEGADGSKGCTNK